jgi:hypothetical protein
MSTVRATTTTTTIVLMQWTASRHACPRFSVYNAPFQGFCLLALFQVRAARCQELRLVLAYFLLPSSS